MAWKSTVLGLAAAGAVLTGGRPAAQPQASPAETLFRNGRVLDVVGGRLGSATNVLVRGNVIAAIGPAVSAAADATVVDGLGRTLMPGLIDAHHHIAFGSLSLEALYSPQTTEQQLGAAAAAS